MIEEDKWQQIWSLNEIFAWAKQPKYMSAITFKSLNFTDEKLYIPDVSYISALCLFRTV